MGLFTPRPEEPTEWAGLPSEPLEVRSPAETLAAPPASADPLALFGETIESIVIPAVPVVATTEPASESGEPDPPA